MSHIATQSWLIDRRRALRGLGSFIALPFLECMVPARAAETTPSGNRAAREMLDVPAGWEMVNTGVGFVAPAGNEPVSE